MPAFDLEKYVWESWRQLAVRYGKDSGGKWITLGAQVGQDGERHGGSRVFIDGSGRITKGHPSLTGRKVGALEEEGAQGTHRLQLHASKGYERATRAKKARQEGIDPKQLHSLAGEFLAHDQAHKDDVRALLKEVRKSHPHLKAVQVRAGRGIDADAVRGLDDVADAMAHRAEYRHVFAGHGSSEERLFDLLAAGNPEAMSEEDAYEQAFDHLAEHAHGSQRERQAGEDSLDNDDEPAGTREHEEAVPFGRRQPVSYAREMHEAWNRNKGSTPVYMTKYCRAMFQSYIAHADDHIAAAGFNLAAHQPLAERYARDNKLDVSRDEDWEKAMAHAVRQRPPASLDQLLPVNYAAEPVEPDPEDFDPARDLPAAEQFIAHNHLDPANEEHWQAAVSYALRRRQDPVRYDRDR